MIQLLINFTTKNIGGAVMGFSVTKNAHIIDSDTRTLISNRYKRITKAINQTFWGSSSETAHSFYVGSYGRGTAINTSDLDVLIELPDAEFDHFSSLYGNGQSRLLQSVKNALLSTYPNTNIKGDGQVVVVKFSEGMKFEILPAFKKNTIFGWDGTYKYPDTHMGGNWMTTNPKAEQEAMKEKNCSSNGLLFDTCKHVRYVRDTCFSSYHLSGILIDTFLYHAIGGWHFLREGEQHSGGTTTYEEALLKYYNDISLNGYIIPSLKAPGSDMNVDTSRGWEVLGKVLKYMV